MKFSYQQTDLCVYDNNSPLPWFWQIFWGTAFICLLGLASDSLALTVNPTSLKFSAVAGSTNPPNQTFTASKSTSSSTLTASDNAAWLTVSLAASSSSTVWFSVAVNTSGLVAGTYTGAITVKEGTSASTVIPVTLMISPATQSTTTTTTSKTATLTWSPVTGTSLYGYKIYVGKAPGQYTTTITAGNVTSYSVGNLLLGITYYFVVTAYNSAGESPPSNEVHTTIY